MQSNTIELITKKLLAPPWGELHHHGPILLAWMALLDHFEKTDLSDSSLQLSDTLRDPNSHKELLQQKAIQLDPIKHLHTLLSECFSEPEPNIICFKDVIFEFLCSVFPFISFTIPPLLVDLYAKVFSNNPVSSASFLTDIQNQQEGSECTIFHDTLCQFPYRVVPFLKLVTSLVNDPHSAFQVYHSLLRVHTFTSSGRLSQMPFFRLESPGDFPISDAYTIEELSFFLPSHTIGEQSDGYVIWRFEYSLFPMLLAIVEAFLDRIAIVHNPPSLPPLFLL